MFEKLESLRDKLLAIKGWAQPSTNLRDAVDICYGNGGYPSILYRNGNIFVTSSIYLLDFMSDGEIRLQRDVSWRGDLESVEIHKMEAAVDLIYKDVDRLIKSKIKSLKKNI